jgi:tripartite-type tricarboxylate transporter receptor subunit TctC
VRGEHIEGAVLSLGALSPHMKSRAFRGLVASSRLPDFAEVPTMRDLGYEQELFAIWFSFLAPAGIPDEARNALVAAIERAVKDPVITARLASAGIVQSYGTPDEMAVEMRAELKRVGDLARKTGLVK